MTADHVESLAPTLIIDRAFDMLRTSLTTSFAAGADVKVLQRMLGHASAALTLDRYGHLLPGQAEAVAARLDLMARQAGCAPVAPPDPSQPPRDKPDVS